MSGTELAYGATSQVLSQRMALRGERRLPDNADLSQVVRRFAVPKPRGEIKCRPAQAPYTLYCARSITRNRSLRTLCTSTAASCL
eukprot:2609551-Rhodomonas_salina.1